VLTAGRMPNGLYGGSSTGSGGDAVYSVFGRLNVLVDQYCWLTRRHNKKEGRELATYCAKQRKLLTKKLRALTAPPAPMPIITPTAGTGDGVREPLSP
jgi:hypothetical protein